MWKECQYDGRMEFSIKQKKDRRTDPTANRIRPSISLCVKTDRSSYPSYLLSHCSLVMSFAVMLDHSCAACRSSVTLAKLISFPYQLMRFFFFKNAWNINISCSYKLISPMANMKPRYFQRTRRESARKIARRISI